MTERGRLTDRDVVIGPDWALSSGEAWLTFLALLGSLLLSAAVALPTLYSGGLRHTLGAVALLGNTAIAAVAVAVSYAVLVAWRRLPPATVGLALRRSFGRDLALGTLLG